MSCVLYPKLAFAQATTQEIFEKAKILQVIKETSTIVDGGYTTLTQTLKLQILDNPDKDKIITLDQANDARLATLQKYTAGQEVVLDKTTGPDGSIHYSVSDSYRIPSLIFLVVLFAIFTILIAGKKGVGAIIGLSVSLAIIIGFIVPQILFYQQDPLTISILGSFAILFITTFLAHGISRQTAIAVASTFLALILTYFFAVFFVWLTHLIGLGTEDSYLLELSPNIAINPKGILLGGIIIGTLGALNDITTTQVASIFALFKANKEQTFLHLVTHGINIGREHIASLVNTLVLAYAGTGLPIFIFILLNPQHMPLWVMLNNQQIGEEIVRTIAGSMGLMLAVPIATILGAYLAPKINSNRA